MSFVRRVLEHAQRYIPPARSGTAVLAYHLVGAGTQTVVDVPLDEFRRQLDWLMSECEVTSLAQVTGHAPAAGSRPRVVLTFDDAYRNFLELAWPELAARQLPAILYVPVGFVRGAAPPPLRGASLPALTFAQIKRMVGSGLAVGSHSVSHCNLRRLPERAVAQELSESREALEQELEITIDSFCYPQAKVSRRVAQLAAHHYTSAVTAGGRPYLDGSLLTIPRFPVRRGQSDLPQMVGSRLWLSEAIAHQVRQFRA